LLISGLFKGETADFVLLGFCRFPLDSRSLKSVGSSLVEPNFETEVQRNVIVFLYFYFLEIPTKQWQTNEKRDEKNKKK
jgi:hypothetical protein